MSVFNRFAHYFQQARAAYGISVFTQLLEIARLRLGQGCIGPGDYYTYRLFERDIPWSEKRRFVGWKAETKLDALNAPQWHCLGLDKVLMYAIFQNGGIRIPETKAIYLPGRQRLLEGATCLTNALELHEWLREPDRYPFFSKPSASGFARGAFFASGLDRPSDTIIMRDGSRIPVLEFAHRFRDIERLGYLFQTPVKPDRRLAAQMGETPVSSLRLMILLDEDEGPVLHRAFWKIPTGLNMSDNFNSGRSGNLAAAISHESGAIVRIIAGVGQQLSEIECHPDTGAKLKDLMVPDWPKVKEFAFRAALTLPKLRFQQWDIALSNDGPLALEVNLFGTGGCDLTQLLYRKGLLDDTMTRFLDRHSHL